MRRRFFHNTCVISHFLSFITALSAVTIFAFTPLKAEEREWRLVYESNGITAHKRTNEGSRFFEFKAVGDLRGAISEYVSVLLDTNSMPEWAPQCFEARNIEQVNDLETIIYVACNGVWPVADRDYVAKRTVISDRKTSTIRIDIELTDNTDAPDIKSRVHIPHLKCYWTLERIDPIHTHVELHAFVDPGGRLPAWLVNWGYRRIPYKYLKNLESNIVEHMPTTTVLVSALSHQP